MGEDARPPAPPAGTAADAATTNSGTAAPNNDTPNNDTPNNRLGARLSCGFFPWATPELHGEAGLRGTILNHEVRSECEIAHAREHILITKRGKERHTERE